MQRPSYHDESGSLPRALLGLHPQEVMIDKPFLNHVTQRQVWIQVIKSERRMRGRILVMDFDPVHDRLSVVRDSRWSHDWLSHQFHRNGTKKAAGYTLGETLSVFLLCYVQFNGWGLNVGAQEWLLLSERSLHF